jgi:hypothetical protein
MKSITFIVGLFGAVAVAASAAAQTSATTDPVRLALAREVIEATGGAQAAATRLNSTFAAVRQLVKSQLPPESANLSDAVFKYVVDEEVKALPAMLDDVAQVYAEPLSETELKDMLAWYTSPSGRTIMAKLPAINQAIILRQGPLMKSMMQGVAKTAIDRACTDAHCSAEQRQTLTTAFQRAMPAS